MRPKNEKFSVEETKILKFNVERLFKKMYPDATYAEKAEMLNMSGSSYSDYFSKGFPIERLDDLTKLFSCDRSELFITPEEIEQKNFLEKKSMRELIIGKLNHLKYGWIWVCMGMILATSVLIVSLEYATMDTVGVYGVFFGLFMMFLGMLVEDNSNLTKKMCCRVGSCIFLVSGINVVAKCALFYVGFFQQVFDLFS